MGTYNSPNQAQSQPESRFRSAAITPIQAVPDILNLPVGYSYAGIADPDNDLILPPAHVDGDGPPCSGILDGVIEQIGKDLPNAIYIQQYREFLGQGRFNRNALLLGGVAIELGNVLDKPRDIDGPPSNLMTPVSA